MKKVFAIRLTAVFIALMIIAGCSTQQSNSGKDDGTLKVVTTYSILYDIVKGVGGQHVSIHSIVPIGTDPHELTRCQRMFSIRRMQTLFYIMA
ncbi:hypothetical protein BSAF29S_02055 [Bacillus safensis subsp. safensis]